MDCGLRVALGPRRYRVECPFGALPEGGVTDVTVAPDGDILVLMRADCRVAALPDPVVVLAPGGALRGRWGGARIADPHKIVHDGAARIWIVNRDCHEVVGFDPEGREAAALGTRDRPGAPFDHPTDAAPVPDGVLVADGYAAGRVVRFDAEGRETARFGGLGRAPGEFRVPHGIAATGAGEIAVADRENGRLQLFSGAGALRGVVDLFHRPSSVAALGDGTLLVADAIPTLTHLTAAGEVLGRCRPTQNGPHGMAVGPDGCIYLAENNPNRVTRLVPEEVT